jgi:hypothetical protein
MSNYSQTTDFSAKDSLASGNASKVIKGSDVDTEFNAIATAIATKKDTATSDIPSGTMMLFVRTSAPTGWTLSTTWNNVVPIIKSSVTDDGTPDTAGNWTISSTELKMNFPSTAFSGAVPAHTHAVGNLANATYAHNATASGPGNRPTPAIGESTHTHTISGNTGNLATNANVSTTVTIANIAPASGTMQSGNWRPAHVEVIACSKD